MTPADVEVVGRDATLGEFAVLLDRLEAGRGGSVLLTGPPGIGKSTVAESVIDLAQHRGLAVVVGWAAEDVAPPFWPWRTMLDLLGIDPATDGGGDRQVLFAAVVEALHRTVTSPLLVVVEDMHWADEASVRLLRVVARAAPHLPVLVVATSRDDPTEAAAIWSLLQDLPPAVRRISLPGLPARDVGTLAEQVWGGPIPLETAAELHRRTGGNPFFVREIARLMAVQGTTTVGIPTAVREVLTRRLARLSEPCFDLVVAAAVAADSSTVELLAEMDGSASSDVLDRLDEAVQAGLLEADLTPRVRFAHALVREVAYEGLPAGRRARLHLAVAEYLSAHDGDPARLTHHWSRASGVDARRRATAYAEQAAAEAMRRCAFEQAADFLRVVLADPSADRVATLLSLADALAAAARWDEARQAYYEAAAAARAGGRAADLAAAALGLGGGIGGFEVPAYDEAQLALLAEALDAVPSDQPALRAALLARTSVAAAHVATVQQRRAQAEEAVQLARAADRAVEEIAALAAYCDAIADPRHWRDRLVATDRMLELARAAGDARATLLTRRFRVVARLESGDLVGVDEEIAAYAHLAARLNQPSYSWYAALWRGMRALLDGDTAAARRAVSATRRIGGEAGSGNAFMLAWTLLAALPDLSPAERSTLHAQTEQISALLPVLPANAAAGIAGLLARCGDLDGARRFAERVRSGSTVHCEEDSERLGGLHLLGEAALALGDPALARAVVETLAPDERLWVVDGIGAACYGPAALMLGRLSAFIGERDRAVRWLRQAVADTRAAGAAGLTQQAEAELAGAQELSPPPQHSAASPSAGLHREGPVWRVRWDGVEATVRHSKGLADIATLVSQGDREVPALDLAAPAGAPPPGSAGEVLDSAARAAYRRRLAELEEALADAERDADTGRATALRGERDFLAAELAAALGLGGRARLAGDPAERARKAVSQRIGNAVSALEDAIPGLGRHLRMAVVTGRFCSYRPDRHIDWDVRF